MRAERERIATQYRSEGDAEAMRIRAQAQAEQARIIAEAEASAERIRGDAEAEATRIYGEAYSVDPAFYSLVRTLESYERGIDEDTVLILPAEADFFRLFINPELDGPVLIEPPTAEIQTLGDASDDDNSQG
jgi:membrane protease subunit HflC